MPARQRTPQKKIRNSRSCKGQNSNRAKAFSALQTFSPSKCSAALGSPRLAAVAFLLRSAACANARWWRHEHGARGGGRHDNQIYFFRCFQQRLVLIGRFLTSVHSGRVLIAL